MTSANHKPINLSAWGFTPGSRIDKYGVLYSKDKAILIDGREAKGVYEVAPTVKRIHQEAFKGADIEELIIPPGVKKIPKAMCKGCKLLRDVVMPRGITEIDGGAFLGCEALTKIDIPASVRAIGRGAFSSCRGLTEVIIPNGCTIGEGAFHKNSRVMTPEEALKWRAQQAMEQYVNPEVEVIAG